MDKIFFLCFFYTLESILILLVLYIIKKEYAAQNIALLFWLTIFAIYVLPSLFDPFVKYDYTGYHRSTDLRYNNILLKAHMFVLCFSVIYLLARYPMYTLEKKQKPMFSIKYLYKNIRKYNKEIDIYILLLTVFAIISLFISVYAIASTKGLSSVLESGYDTYRLEADISYARLKIYLIGATSGGVFLAWYRKRWIFMLIIVLSIFGTYILTFTRQYLFIMAIPFIVYMIWRYEGILARLTMILICFFGYYGLIFLVVLRSFGSFQVAFEHPIGEIINRFIDYVSVFEGESDVRLVYYFFISDDWNWGELIPGQTYLRLLMLPIPPEFSFGIKPKLVDEIIYYIYYESPEIEGGMLNALMFGDSYVNFGWFGIFLGMLWAIIAHLTSKFLLYCHPVVRVTVIAPLGFAAVMTARGSVYNSCAYVFWSSLLIGVIYAISRVSFRIFVFPYKRYTQPITRVEA